MEEEFINEYYPDKFVCDCSRLVGYALNTRLETELVFYLPDAFNSDAERDRFITYLWLVIYFQTVLSRTFRLVIPGWLARPPQWFSDSLVSDGFRIPCLYNERQRGIRLTREPEDREFEWFACKLTSLNAWDIQETDWRFDMGVLSAMAKRVVSICRECDDMTANRLLAAMDEHLESKGKCGVSDSRKQLFVAIKEAIRNEAPLQAVSSGPSVDQLLADLRDKREREEITEEEYIRTKTFLECDDIF
jgi:hypothetical protein